GGNPCCDVWTPSASSVRDHLGVGDPTNPEEMWRKYAEDLSIHYQQQYRRQNLIPDIPACINEAL
ncbi:hypothetical protein EC973_003326, partial [Apophysomyces ossiformis]